MVKHRIRDITRFTSSKEIDHVFKSARSVLKHPSLTLLQAPAVQTYGRILIIASRKVGNSPQRNLIKRRIKSIFYEEAFYKKPYDWICIARKSLVETSFTELRNIICPAMRAW